MMKVVRIATTPEEAKREIIALLWEHAHQADTVGEDALQASHLRAFADILETVQFVAPANPPDPRSNRQIIAALRKRKQTP